MPKNKVFGMGVSQIGNKLEYDKNRVPGLLRSKTLPLSEMTFEQKLYHKFIDDIKNVRIGKPKHIRR